MIKLPDPPTGNLYKFIAILGLAVMVASAALLVGYKEWRLTESEPMARATRELTDSMMALSADRANPKVTSAEYEVRLSRAKHLRDVWVAEVDRYISNVDARDWKYYASLGGLIVGAGLAAAGFFLWYHRLQRHLDQMVRAQATPAPPAATSPTGEPKSPLASGAPATATRQKRQRRRG